jgi:hypothetical protein
MVIGDSLAQGCRSLSIKADYCAQSWAARIAGAQKWEFIAPDFPREVLFDLEHEIRLLDTLSLTRQAHLPAPLTNAPHIADALRIMKSTFQP